MLNLKSKWVKLSAGLMAGAALLWASGIAPQAYNLIVGNGTPAGRGSTLSFPNTASVSWSCSTTGIVTTCLATASGGGGGSGGGIVTYSSGAALTPAGTQFVAIGGGGQASATESDVEIGAPSAATISSMFVNLDLPAGTGNSIAFIWRKAGADQTLTCTISGVSATTCSDTTHSFTVAQGDLIDIKLVTTGTVIVAPGLTIATAYGVSGSAGYLTIQNNGTPLAQEPVLNLTDGTNTTMVCADNPGVATNCQVNASGGGGGTFSALPPYLYDGTNYFAPSSAVVKPVPGNFTWQNQGGATNTTTANGAIYLLGTNGSLDNRFYEEACPGSTPYTITVAFMPQLTANTFAWLGFGFRDPVAGRLEYMALEGNGAQIEVALWGSIAGFAGRSANRSVAAVPSVLWFRVGNDGTNLTFSWSVDGINFFQILADPISGGFLNATPTQCGFFLVNNDSSPAISAMTVLSVQ
jgi:hypothetical protein